MSRWTKVVLPEPAIPIVMITVGFLFPFSDDSVMAKTQKLGRVRGTKGDLADNLNPAIAY